MSKTITSGCVPTEKLIGVRIAEPGEVIDTEPSSLTKVYSRTIVLRSSNAGRLQIVYNPLREQARKENFEFNAGQPLDETHNK